MSERKPRYRLRLISDSLQGEAWSELAAHEGLTPKEGYVEWEIDDYEDLGHEVCDYLGPRGTLVLGWQAAAEAEEGYSAPGDLWLQVDKIVEDLMSDWLKAKFKIILVTDENELTIEFEALLD